MRGVLRFLGVRVCKIILIGLKMDCGKVLAG